MQKRKRTKQRRRTFERLEDRRVLAGFSFHDELLTATLEDRFPVGSEFDLEPQGDTGQLDLFVIHPKSLEGRLGVSIYSGESNFTESLGTFVTTVPISGFDPEFEVRDWNNDGVQDLVQIQDFGTTSGKVEMRVMDGASGFQTQIAYYETGFDVGDSPDQWSWDIQNVGGSSFADLVGIQVTGTASGNVRVRSVNGEDVGSGRFQSVISDHHTIIPSPEGDGASWQFDVDDFNRDGTDDVVAVITGGGYSLTPLRYVFILDGTDDYQSLLHESSTAAPETAGSNRFELARWANPGSEPELIQFSTHVSGTTQVKIYDGEGAALEAGGSYTIRPVTPFAAPLDYRGIGSIAIDTAAIDTNIPMNIEGLDAGLSVEVTGDNSLTADGTLSGTINLKITDSSMSLAGGTKASGTIAIVLTEDGQLFAAPGSEIDTDELVKLQGASVFTIDREASVTSLQIDVSDNSVLDVQGGSITSQNTIPATGTINLGDSAEIDADIDLEGILAGLGQIEGHVDASGTLKPGDVGIQTENDSGSSGESLPQVGRITMGGLSLTNTAKLEMEVDGGLNHDQLVINSGNLDLGNANLKLSVAPTIQPIRHDEIYSLVLIDNQTASPLNTIFGNIEYNGAAASAGRLTTNFGGTGYNARLNYEGGDGNDLVLEFGPFQVVQTSPPLPGGGNTLELITYSDTLDANSVNADSIRISGTQSGRRFDPNNSLFVTSGDQIDVNLPGNFFVGEEVTLSFTDQVRSSTLQNARAQTVRFTVPAEPSPGGFDFADEMFVPSSELDGEFETDSSALADFNGDGRLDAAMSFHDHLVFWMSNDSGGHDEIIQSTPNTQAFEDLVTQDFNGDGLVDVLGVKTGYDDQSILYLSNEQGGPSIGQSFSEVWGTATAGDIDGDGDIDILTGDEAYNGPGIQNGTAVNIWLNDGSGAFTKASIPGHRFVPEDFDNSYTSQTFALLDFDGDFDLDLAILSRHGLVYWQNDGAGDFIQWTSLDIARMNFWGTPKLAVGDIDGDSFEDLVVAYTENTGTSQPTTLRWFPILSVDGVAEGNEPSHAASRVPFPQFTRFQRVRDLVLADTDGDGDLDLMLATYTDATSRNGYAGLLHYEGHNGSFATDPTTVLPAEYMRRSIDDITLGDVNGDGTLDFFLAEKDDDWQSNVIAGKSFFHQVSDSTFEIPSHAATGVSVGQVTIDNALIVDGSFEYELLAGDWSDSFAINAQTGEVTVADPLRMLQEQPTQLELPFRVTNLSHPEAVQNATATVRLVESLGEQNYELAAATGTAVTLNAGQPGVTTVLEDFDDRSTAIDLGTHSLTVFGQTYSGDSSVFVSTNGTISLGSQFDEYLNQSLDDSNAPTVALLAPFWTDLTTGNDSNDKVLVSLMDVRGDAEPELVVQWSDVYLLSDETDPITFQAIIELNSTTDATIEYQYIDVEVSGTSKVDEATIGIKSAGNGSETRVLQLSHESASPLVGNGKGVVLSSRYRSPVPQIEDQQIELSSLPVDNSVIGSVIARDDYDRSLSYQIVIGNDDGAFSIDPNNGELTLIDSNSLSAGPRLLTVLVENDADPALAQIAQVTVQHEVTPVELIVTSAVHSNDANPGDGIAADSQGRATLRAAIQEANALPGHQTISFAFAETTEPILIATPFSLPTITETVTIDGATQAGYVDRPLIRLDGSGIEDSNSFGFDIQAGDVTINGFEIFHFRGAGIQLIDSSNAVLSNLVLDGGVTEASTTSGFYNYGIYSERSTHATIENNVVIRHQNAGMAFQGVNDGYHTIRNNWIGTNASGETNLGNISVGLALSHSEHNEVIGNTIAGNEHLGIAITGSGATSNSVLGNVIGLAGLDAEPLPNGSHGVLVAQASGNQIGGPNEADGNVIAGNQGSGLVLSRESSSNVVQNNRIGVSPDGQAARPNRHNGVYLRAGASNNQVLDNQIASNLGSQISIVTATSRLNLVQGNTIGFDADGNTLPGGSKAVYVNAPDNWVGGSDLSDANVISGSETGIAVSGEVATGNRIENNVIGMDQRDHTEAGEMLRGVSLLAGAAGNEIVSNTIGFSRYVAIDSPSDGEENLFSRNRFPGSAFTIDLGRPGRNNNDPGDADVGANRLQNSPTVTEADVLTNEAATLEISVTFGIDSDPAHSRFPLTVEFYLADASGLAIEYFDSIIVEETDAQAEELQATLTRDPALLTVRPEFVAATVTDADNNTSEVGEAVAIDIGGDDLGEVLESLPDAPDAVREGADVNGDRRISAADALDIINTLNLLGAQGESLGSTDESNYDVNQDGRVSAADALVIINQINAADSSPITQIDQVLSEEDELEILLEEAMLEGLF